MATRLLLALLVVLSFGGAVRAQTSAQDEIDAIREAILYARYEDAISDATAFLDRDDLSAAHRNAGLEVLATAHLANRDMEAAEALLAQLYARDPGHHLGDSDASPLVQGAFQRAREASPAPVSVELTHTAPDVRGRRSPQIEVEVREGLDVIGELRLNFRNVGAPRFATLVLHVDDDGVARGRLPLVGAPGEAQRISYYVEAFSPSMTQMGAIASERDPLMLDIPAESTSAWAEYEDPNGGEGPAADEEGGSKWWIALIVLGVAAGAGVGGYFLLGPPSDEPTGNLGAVDLR